VKVPNEGVFPLSATDTESPVVVDDARNDIVARFTAALGDAVVDSLVKPGDDVWIRVRTDAWRAAGDAARQLGFVYFDFLSAIDWMPSPFGRGEDDPTEPAPERDMTVRQGYAGGETRMQVLGRVVDPTTTIGVNLKADVADDSPVIESWVTVFAGANWHEREGDVRHRIRRTSRLAQHVSSGRLRGPPFAQGLPTPRTHGQAMARNSRCRAAPGRWRGR